MLSKEEKLKVAIELIQEDENREKEYKKQGLGQPVKENEIYVTKIGLTILVNCKEVLVDLDRLKFHYDEYMEEEYLNLSEIKKQLRELSYSYSYTVIYETALEGKIYTYGNWGDSQWYLTGKTIGYA